MDWTISMKQSVLQDPDGERTNQSTPICLALALPYNKIMGLMPFCYSLESGKTAIVTVEWFGRLKWPRLVSMFLQFFFQLLWSDLKNLLVLTCTFLFDDCFSCFFPLHGTQSKDLDGIPLHSFSGASAPAHRKVSACNGYLGGKKHPVVIIIYNHYFPSEVHDKQWLFQGQNINTNNKK